MVTASQFAERQKVVVSRTLRPNSRKTKGGKLFRGQSSIKERDICIYSQMAECDKNPNYPSKKKGKKKL